MKKIIRILLYTILILALAAALSFAVPRLLGRENAAPDEGRQGTIGEEVSGTEESAAPEPESTPAPAAAETPVPKTVDTPAPEPEASWEPDFTFTTVDFEGREWTDRVFADAELTMLNMWAYWCGPCVGELPDLQKLYENYADRGFQILGISMVEYEKENADLMESLGITYPCLRLTESLDAELNTGYIPATLFVDGEGHILGEVMVGSKSYDQWAAIVEGYLG